MRFENVMPDIRNRRAAVDGTERNFFAREAPATPPAIAATV